MPSERVVRAARYSALLLLSLLFAGFLALLVANAPALTLQERAYALAAALVAYAACAFAFAALWPWTVQGDAILLDSPAIAVVAVFAALTVVAPEPTPGREGELLVLLGASALVVLLGTLAGATVGRYLGLRREAAA